MAFSNMNKFSKIVVLSALLFHHGSTQTDSRDNDEPLEEDIDCTLTQWGGPSGPGKDCVFPFKYLGVVSRKTN